MAARFSSAVSVAEFRSPSRFRLAADLVPAVAAVAGLALAAARWQSHWRVGPRDMIPDRPPRDPVQAARIDEELERFGQ